MGRHGLRGRRPLDVIGIPAENFDDWAPYLESYFRTFERNTNGVVPAGVFADAVRDGTKQCWVIAGEEIRGCVLTSVGAGNQKSVTLEHIAGEGHREWVNDVYDTITAWARDLGADWFFTTARPGFVPFLKGRGMRARRVQMEIRLNG